MLASFVFKDFGKNHISKQKNDSPKEIILKKINAFIKIIILLKMESNDSILFFYSIFYYIFI